MAHGGMFGGTAERGGGMRHRVGLRGQQEKGDRNHAASSAARTVTTCIIPACM